MVNLGRSAASGGDFNLSDSLVDDFVGTDYRLRSSERRDDGQNGACEPFYHLAQEVAYHTARRKAQAYGCRGSQPDSHSTRNTTSGRGMGS
jgi:hypothetical protein